MLDAVETSTAIEFMEFSRKLFILFYFSGSLQHYFESGASSMAHDQMGTFGAYTFAEFMNQAALAFRTIDKKVLHLQSIAGLLSSSTLVSFENCIGPGSLPGYRQSGIRNFPSVSNQSYQSKVE